MSAYTVNWVVVLKAGFKKKKKKKGQGVLTSKQLGTYMLTVRGEPVSSLPSKQVRMVNANDKINRNACRLSCLKAQKHLRNLTLL